MACELDRHSFRSSTVWKPYQKVDGVFSSEKRVTRVCSHCRYQYVLAVKERRRYGGAHLPLSLESTLEGGALLLARSMLIDLVKSNTQKKWTAWMNKWMGWDYGLVDECVRALFQWGLIVKQEKKVKDRINCWDTHYVSANLSVVPDIRRLLGITDIEQESDLPDRYKELQPTTEKGRHVKQVILNLFTEHQVPKGDKTVTMLSGIYELAEEQKNMSWKVFSQTYFSSTKSLTRHDRSRLRSLLGSKLSEFGIQTGDSRVLLAADFSWEWQGYVNNGLGFFGSLSLPRTMIGRMKMISWQSPRLLVIENKDLFDLLINSQWLDTKNWAIMFGKGYFSSEELSIIVHAAQFQLQSIVVWPDLDPFGLSIAFNLIEKLEAIGVFIPISLFGFTSEWANRFTVTRSLEAEDKDEINRLIQKSLPLITRQALEWMLETNQKCEQEMAFEMLDRSSFEVSLMNDSIPL